MTRTLYLLCSTLIFCTAILLNACVDDGLGFSNALSDGEAELTLDLSFSPLSEADLTRAHITDGNGKDLNTINDLCLLVYDADGNLFEGGKYTYPLKIDLSEHPVTDEERNDSDASNGTTAESRTKSVKGISLSLPFGRYFIVGVANLKGGTLERLTSSDEYKTLSGLRRMKMSWNNSDITENCEMMGYFTDTEMTASNSVPTADRAFASVAVNRAGMNLHSWLRRCASKITIDFDGSNLRDNVTVYIKEAKIYDIPYDCTLGFGARMISTDESEAPYNHFVSKDGETPDGFFQESPQVISYADNTGETSAGEDWENWPAISKETPVLKDNVKKEDYPTAKVIDFHAEKADALYFYENMQENPEKKTKIPAPDLSAGGVAGKDETKDGIKYGTYIEVTGYYNSDADGNPTHGEIKYRFMLGQNVTDDFKAERNYHYKLTLCPRGNGNDADWHIEFNEPKGFHVPNPWYVSYLYNHDATLPFKYIPDDDWEVVGLVGEIVTNPWYPTKCEIKKLSDTSIVIEPTTPDGDDPAPYNNSLNQGNYNGFLSLRAPDNVVITSHMAAGKDWPGYNKGGNNINEAYYNGTAPSTSKINRGYRIYLKDGKEYEYDDYAAGSDVAALKERDKFTWQKDGNAMLFSIPLFTRSKVLVKETGYSGNNPFVGYQRIARVKLTVTLKNKKDGTTKTDSELVNAVQVRRVVNPKGVYRKSRNHEPFHVKMMWLDGDKSPQFSEVESEGPWKAEIIGDNNFITLDGRQSVSASGGKIDFTIRFNRMNNDNKVRNAVVRIKYHNYTCTHLIFVRQGYDPQELMPSDDCMDFTTRNGDTGEFHGGATPVAWRTCNMISENHEASDPRDEGSLFKFRNSAQAIDAVNNIYKDDDGHELYHNLDQDEFKNNTGPFWLVDDNGKLSDEKTGWTEMKVGSGFNGKMANTATMRDFEQLYLSRNVNFGYGVLYADGATETQKDVSMAYGYYRRDNYPGGGSPKGMRGMFAYYWDGKSVGGSSYNGRNIFFPIGRAGYGHRKDKKEGATGTEPGNGILRYSCNRGAPRVDIFTNDAPIFVSIYRRPGAIYWARDKIIYHNFLMYDRKLLTDASGDAFGLDINYFSFDVNAILTTNVGFTAHEEETGKVGDACFVRCVGNDTEAQKKQKKQKHRSNQARLTQ